MGDEDEVNQSSDFSLFPCEVALKFFKYLGHAEKKKCRSVCRRWLCFLDSNYFAFRPKLNNISATEFFNSNQIMDKVTMKNMTNKMPSSSFPDIENAIVGWGNSEENIVRFLKDGCDWAMSLILSKFSFGEINVIAVSNLLRDKTWTHLSEMNIVVILAKPKLERAVNHLEAVILFLKTAQVPNIRKFGLEFVHKHERCSTERDLRFRSICLTFYEFIAGHSKSLKILNCRIATNRKQKFNIPEIPKGLKECYKADLNLESCTLTLRGVAQIENLITPELFGSQLKNLALQTLSPPNWVRSRATIIVGENVITLENNIAQVFANNQTALRNATFWGFPFVTMSWFTNCSALESVQIGPIDGGPYFSTLPLNIFESSCLSLRKIMIHSFGSLDFSCFRNCVKLEEMDINILEGMSSVGSLNSQMNLKKIAITMVEGNDFTIQEIQSILDRSGPRVEYLDARLFLLVQVAINISLEKCTDAKSIIIQGRRSLMQNNVRHYFSNLTYLECEIYDVHMTEQIVKNMPNLATVGLVLGPDSPDDYLPKVKVLLGLPKVANIELWVPPYDTRADTSATQEFCNLHPGLKFEKGKSAFRRVVTVDRSLYN